MMTEDTTPHVDAPSVNPDVDDPCALLGQWLDHAKAASGQPNWNAMMVATVDDKGRPSVRPVLNKTYDPATGCITFFTNYHSRKAREIEANANVAIVMHWDHLDRQVRVEGTATRASDEASDAYFASRRRESQLGAWASDQSQPLESYEALVQRVLERGMEFKGDDVPRPPHWGGYVIEPRCIEFWIGSPSRVHQRARFDRDASTGAWDGTWLNP